jgi:hypothetical protein
MKSETQLVEHQIDDIKPGMMSYIQSQADEWFDESSHQYVGWTATEVLEEEVEVVN